MRKRKKEKNSQGKNNKNESSHAREEQKLLTNVAVWE
jgi:hypothetical protein